MGEKELKDPASEQPKPDVHAWPKRDSDVLSRLQKFGSATLDPPARAGRTSAPKQAQGSPEKVPNVPSETGENLLKTASFLPKADCHAFPWFPNAGSRL